MQRQQLTLDAAYKFALWYLLLCEAKDNQGQTEECASHDAYVRHTAVSLIRASLPRRTQRSCCLSGACGRNSLTHRTVHFGRPEVQPAQGERDDVCQCLAHATACVGRPVRLFLRDYISSASLTGDRYGGLRCMLRHIPLECVTFSSIPDPRDAQHVVDELGAVLKSGAGRLLRLSLGGFPAYVRIAPLLQAMTLHDTVTELRLEDCGIQDVSVVVCHMRASMRLRRLSLRGNHGISDGMPALALAVAASACLLSLDVGLCRLRDEHLEVFLRHLQGFAVRARFVLDASSNVLSNACFADLRDAPAAFRETLSELDLSGHNFSNGGDAAAATLTELPALTGLVLNQCELGPRDMQRLCRVLSQKERQWRQLSFRGNALTVPDMKRLTLASFAADSCLCVAGNNISAGVPKLGLASVLPLLRELDLSLCDIGDEGVQQLASGLEKAQPLALRVLRLDGNGIGVEGKKGRGGVQFLGRALRASHAPALELLSLAHNRLALRPLLTLVEQVACTLRELHVSYSSVATDGDELAELVGRIVRRQKSGSHAFLQLDVWALHPPDTDATRGTAAGAAMAAWLEGQRSLRVITEAR
ncbi:hypothetical protein DQ04_03931070 [Trypanosoma grayi]|uniref:hypothetical protein n=1 Tax=Trypanosoma grayi TaxID=71804 RepID=UPI0004F4AEC5|nr:hypothetical protein DQ04_03931070 [Trypanosoma grayi]KEG10289.1 hypothetical protein DQ04_03931070 [Trypanosoma grayi]